MKTLARQTDDRMDIPDGPGSMLAVSSKFQRRGFSLAVSGETLTGRLTVPARPRGIVLLIQNEGACARLANETAYVCQTNNFATLQADLLTADEKRSQWARALEFDIEMMSNRIGAVVAAMGHENDLARLPAACLTSGTASAAALIHAARHGQDIRAVTSVDGRVDLASHFLPFVKIPVLLIADGHNEDIASANRKAYENLNPRCALQIVTPNAAMDECRTGERAAAWFRSHL